MNYKIRMIEELLNLQSKITKLELFLESKENNLEKEKISLMSDQLSAMYSYKNILLQRIELEVGQSSERCNNK